MIAPSIDITDSRCMLIGDFNLDTIANVDIPDGDLLSSEHVIDLQKVNHYDSALLAFIVQWKRCVTSLGGNASIEHQPKGFESLREFYKLQGAALF